MYERKHIMPDNLKAALLQTDWGQGLVLSTETLRQMKAPPLLILLMMEKAMRSKCQRRRRLRKTKALEGQMHTFTSN